MTALEIPDDAYSAPLISLLDALDGEAGSWRIALARDVDQRGEVWWRLTVDVDSHDTGAELARILGAQPRDPLGTHGAYWSGWYADMECRETRVTVTAPEAKATVTLRRLARDLADTADQAGAHTVAEHAREAARAVETGGAS